MTNETTPTDAAAMPPASAGSQPVAWMTDDGNYFTSKIRLAREWREAGVDLVPLYVRQPQPTLTDEERHAIAVVRNCAMARAGRFLTQSDAEREATLVLWRLRERLG